MERLLQLASSPGVRRAAGWALRATGPVVLAFLLIRVVDYEQFRGLLADLQYAWLLAALGAMELIILLRTLRWIELHKTFGLEPAPFTYQLRLTYAASLATLVLPQVVNPLSRLVLLLQDGYRAGRALVASITEKLLDFGSYVAFGVAGTIALASTFGGLAWWAIGLIVAVMCGLGLLYAGRSHIGQLATSLLKWFPGVGQADAQGADTVGEILSLDRAVAVRLALWSTAISLTQATMLFFITRSVGVDLSYGFMVAVWGVIALSFLLPISVNGIGTREAILVTAFSAVDRSTDAAVAIGLLSIVVVAVGSSPGIIEWVRRLLFGSGRGESDSPAVAAPAGRGTT